jgi:hypothetical protein
MFDVPVDAWYVWLGLAVASAALVGVGASLPTGPPPAAAGAADTVDRTAATDHPATATHPLDADEIRIGPRQLGLRTDAGSTHAVYAFGPVTPAVRSPFDAVLRGVPPDARFDSGDDLCSSAAAERDRPRRWQPADGSLVVRHVVWEGCDVTLVG